jgi:hypothetical protein
MNSRIVLKASDVASILGRNQYKPRQEVLNDLWKKYAPQTFTGKTKKDKAEEALSASTEAQAVLASALSTKAKDSLEVQKIFSEALQKVNSDSKLSATQKAEVTEHLRSKVYTTHGTRSEDKTAEKVEELKTEVEEIKKKCKVAEMNAQKAENEAVVAVAAVVSLTEAVKTAEQEAVVAIAAVAPLAKAVKEVNRAYTNAVKNNSGVEEARKVKEELEQKQIEAREKARVADEKKKELEMKEKEARERARITQELRDIENENLRKFKIMVENKSEVADRLPGNLKRDDSFYNYDVCQLGDKKFVVVGKIDRIEERPDGSRVLVEIKNRTNRLFRKVVDYEMIQVQVYLQMLGLAHARLVEQYNNQVLSHEITRDEEMWTNVIVPGLEEFCSELYQCLSPPESS